MIFTKQSQGILKEWVLDFDSAPISNEQIPPYKPIKRASEGAEVHMSFVSAILETALGHLGNVNTVVEGHPHSPEVQLQSAQELATEASVVLTEIEKYYHVNTELGLLRIHKK